MQVTIYLDVIFIVNFLADFLVLLLTGVLEKRKLCWWRIVAGALFGAGMLLFFLLFPFLYRKWNEVIVFIGISMGAVAIAYGGRIGSIIRTWFLSTTIMVLVGSVMNYIRYITGKDVLSLCGWLSLLCFGAVSVVGLFWYLTARLAKRKSLYLIELKQNNQSIIEQVYMDTGNFLWDYLYEKPVLLLSDSVLRRCLTREEFDIVRCYQTSGWLDYQLLLENEIQKKLCFHEIAYKSVGNPSGKLLCLLIEEINIHGTDRVLTKQPVAVAPETLFKGKTYQGLLHPKCI